MNLVKSEKLEKNQHELQFSIDAASFNDASAKAYNCLLYTARCV